MSCRRWIGGREAFEVRIEGLENPAPDAREERKLRRAVRPGQRSCGPFQGAPGSAQPEDKKRPLAQRGKKEHRTRSPRHQRCW